MQQARFGKQQQAVAASTVGLALSYSTIGMMSFGAFVLPLSEAFGWGRGDISVASTIMAYTVALLSPLAGLLADQYGVRRVLLPSLLLFGLGLACVTFITGQIWQLYLAYFLLALPALGTTPVIFSRAIVQWFDKNRGLALGIGLSGVGVGTAIVPLMIQEATEAFTWRGGYITASLLVLCIALPVCWLWLHTPNSAAAQTNAPPAPLGGHTLREASRTRTYWLLVLGFFLLTVFPVGVLSHLIPLLRDRGTSPEVAAFAATSMGAALIFGRLITGVLLDRIFAPIVVVVCMGLAAAGIAMLAAGASGGWALFAAALVGFGVGAEMDFTAYLVSRYHGQKAYARITGTIYAAMGLGQGLGPLIMGYGYQTYGDYQMSLLVILGLTVIGTIPLAILGPYPNFSLSTHEKTDTAEQRGAALDRA